MTTITVGPETAKTMDELTTLTIDGVLFNRGDDVWIEHIPSGQKIFGKLGKFFGVGRIRGIKISAPFVGDTAFYFGQPGDAETYRLTKIEEES